MPKIKIKLLFTALQSAVSILRSAEKTESLLELVRQKISLGLDQLNDLTANLDALVRLIKSWNAGDYRDIPKKAIIASTASVIYFLNPFDFIPDVIPFSGFLDDAAVVTYVVASLKSEIERFLVWERMEKLS